MEAPARVPAAARRARWRRRLLFGVIGLAALVFCAPFFLGPVLRSSTVKAIEEQLDARASVRAVSFSWPGHLRIQGLELGEPSGELLAAVDQVDVDVGLWALLSRRIDARVEVLYPELHVRRDADGQWNWQRVLSRRSGAAEEPQAKAPEPSTTVPALRAELRLQGGEVVIHGPTGADTRLAGIAVETSIHGLDQEAPFTLDLEVRGPNGPAGKLAL